MVLGWLEVAAMVVSFFSSQLDIREYINGNRLSTPRFSVTSPASEQRGSILKLKENIDIYCNETVSAAISYLSNDLVCSFCEPNFRHTYF